MLTQHRSEDPMLRKTFENEIQQVKDDVLVLGSMVEQAILSSVEALKKRDVKASQEIFEADKEINEKRFAIESKLMILIATQQPMAHDLRLLASTLEIISELERMGDYAKGIANINIRMGDIPLLKPLIDIPRMAQIGVDMLHTALTAFVNEDIEGAKSIPVRDDEVDALLGGLPCLAGARILLGRLEPERRTVAVLRLDTLDLGAQLLHAVLHRIEDHRGALAAAPGIRQLHVPRAHGSNLGHAARRHRGLREGAQQGMGGTRPRLARMIDPVLLRENPDLVKRSQEARGESAALVDDAVEFG